MPDEQKIRQIVRDEMTRGNNTSRFGIDTIAHHTHDGVSSLKIKQSNIIPGGSISGSITFARATTYTINLNSTFTPSNIFCTGNISNGTAKYMFVGSAQLGPSFYLQDPTGSLSDNYVVTGGIQYPFTDPNHPTYGGNIPMQSCTYFGAESAGGLLHTLVGNFHIINVAIPSILARATVTDFSKTSITLVVETLSSGYTINANFVIT